MNPISSRALRIGKWLLAASLVASSALAFAAAPINTLKRGRVSESATGTAINGYDAVAYFTESKAVKGSERFTAQHQGATFQFASQAHLDLFKASPDKYVPQYGGYCAYGVSQGYLVSTEPEQFTVREGKLYLNYNADVQKKWTQDIAGYNRTSDAKFGELLKK